MFKRGTCLHIRSLPPCSPSPCLQTERSTFTMLSRMCEKSSFTELPWAAVLAVILSMASGNLSVLECFDMKAYRSVFETFQSRKEYLMLQSCEQRLFPKWDQGLDQACKLLLLWTQGANLKGASKVSGSEVFTRAGYCKQNMFWGYSIDLLFDKRELSVNLLNYP